MGWTSAFSDFSDPIGLPSLLELRCLLLFSCRRTETLSVSPLLLSSSDSSDDSSESPTLVGGLPELDSPLVT